MLKLRTWRSGDRFGGAIRSGGPVATGSALPAPSPPHATDVLIVGGGASGVLLALALLRQASPVRVALVERGGAFGCGLAYGTRDPEHLLNVPPTAMSAYPDEPQHFWHWLKAAGRLAVDAGPFVFVPRHHFGDYLGALLEDVRRTAGGRLTLVEGEVADLEERPDGVTARLTDGRSIAAGSVVLATGHATRVPADRIVPAIDPGEVRPVLILGSGLSMVDRWLSLRRQGFEGPVIALSRHGLLPEAHTGVLPLRFEAGELPLGAPLALLRWLRRRVDEHVASGGDWRSVTDALRPATQQLWAGWDEPARRQFLRHARAYWDVHRHRLAPDVHQRMRRELEQGRLAVIAGTTSAEASSTARPVGVRRRGGDTVATIEVAAVLDCRGLTQDWAGQPGLIGRLFETGHARPDALRTGLDVTADGRIVTAGGISRRLWAVGPLTRGALFEIEAVPDIRAQCAKLAAGLASAPVRAATSW